MWTFAVRTPSAAYGFVAEIDLDKLRRSGFSSRELAGQAREYALAVMRARGNDPDDICVTEPRLLDWDAASTNLRYCQYFGFGPNGGSILFLNRPPTGAIDHLVETAFRTETSTEDPA